MRVFLGGVRGTRPVAARSYLAYGGDTTAILVEGAEGERVLIDAGTGLRMIGERIAASPGTGPLVWLFTHYHLDHLSGFSSFPLLAGRGAEVEIARPRGADPHPEGIIPLVLGEPLWPVTLEELPSRVRFSLWDGGPVEDPRRAGGLAIRWCPVHHHGGSIAYRIDEAAGGSFVFATDIEWRESAPAEREALLRLCAEPAAADLLIMDGQYTEERYPRHRGWGHSTWSDVAEVARRAGVRRFLVTHHDPTCDDASLERIERDVKAAAPGGGLARQGMAVALPDRKDGADR
ncbi:MAG: MBL fold metallo-hydrolase [Planctomycetes bacterium]|nr:MBL fold metallo-hydrolase [Planctomycetota bacterium]